MKILLTDLEAAELLGLSVRKFHYMRPHLCTPVVLGPRCVRYIRSELELGVANLPRAAELSEPAQLLRARIERMKQPRATS